VAQRLDAERRVVHQEDPVALAVAVSAIGGHILAFARVACGWPWSDH